MSLLCNCFMAHNQFRGNSIGDSKIPPRDSHSSCSSSLVGHPKVFVLY